MSGVFKSTGRKERKMEKNRIDERVLDFIPPTDRVRRLIDEVLSTKPELCIERARIVTGCDKTAGMLPPAIKHSRAVAEVLRNMTVFIGDDELIVGNQARKLRAAPVFPEYDVDWISEELDELSVRKADPFIVREEEKEEFREIIEYWKGKTHRDRVDFYSPEEIVEGRKNGVLVGAHLLSGGHGHVAVGYEKILRIGIKGYIAEIDEELAKLDLKKREDLEKIDFLKGAREMLEASIEFARRFADEAERKAAKETDGRRKAELLKIASNCRNVPANPAGDFWEALQCVWFITVIMQIESNGHSISVGRLDKYTEPFYTRDVKQGKLDIYKAQELLACMFIKMHAMNKVKSLAHTIYASGYPMYQNLTIGGQDGIGTDVENDVTYLILNAMENVRFPSPNLTARYWAGSSDRYMKKCVDSISLGFGMPALLSDEVIIPSLLARGVSIEDAYDYCAIGCIEVAVAGKWGYRVFGMTFMNFPKMFEIAINGGTDPRNPDYKWPISKSLAEMESFDEVMEAWRESVKIFAELEVMNDAIADHCLKELPETFTSALIDDCIKRGKMLLEGGAVYDMISGAQIGIADLANSMAGIKKLVFDDKILSGKEMLEVLNSNFETENGEIMRQMMLNKVPKYGNDIDYVDALAREAYEIYMDTIEQYKNTREGLGPIGCGYFAATVTISSNVGSGKNVGATADGRKAGEPLAEGGSPHSGTDTNGPTAVMKSITKFPTVRMTGGQLLNLKFSKDILEEEREKRKLISQLRAFGELKGWHVQINAVSADTLKAAQERPEEYRNLMVRVAGYCALFTDLDVETQNDIIARTEHTRVQ